MKKKLLPLLLVQAALAFGLSPAFGQSVWVAPVTPAVNSMFGNFEIKGLTAPQPGVFWGVFRDFRGRGSVWNFLFTSSDNGQTWQRCEDGFEVLGLDYSALDGQRVWSLFGTTIRHTTTAPNGFTALPNPLPSSGEKIHFFTATTGVVIAHLSAGATTRSIYRTTDGGATWSTITIAFPLSDGTLGAKQNASNSLWVSTINGGVLRTADAGLTWTLIPNVGEVAFENASNGLSFKSTANGQELARTIDGGLTWSPVPISSQMQITTMTAIPGLPGTYMSAASFLPPNSCEFTGVASITRDFGTNWQVVSTDHTKFVQLAAGSPSQIWTLSTYNSICATTTPLRFLYTYSGTALGTRQPQDPALQAVAYPNPTSGLLKLTGPMQGEEAVRVYDAAGRQCYTGKVSEAQRTVDLSAQRAGLYQLLLTSPSGGVRSLKVSKTE